MDYLFFDTDEFSIIIDKLNNEYKCLQDIYEQFMHQTISKSDKIGDFKNIAIDVKTELIRIEEQILSLKNKTIQIKDRYMDVEELNLRVVDKLPNIKDVFDDECEVTVGKGPNINNNYVIVNDDSLYTVNSKYDFEDWLIEWLNNKKY